MTDTTKPQGDVPQENQKTAPSGGIVYPPGVLEWHRTAAREYRRCIRERIGGGKSFGAQLIARYDPLNAAEAAGMVHRVACFYGTGEPRRYRTRCGAIGLTENTSHQPKAVTCLDCGRVTDRTLFAVQAMMCWGDDYSARMEGDKPLGSEDSTELWREALTIINDADEAGVSDE
ncbi:MAG: hypothetical protein IID41_07380 [Planctomycetes bacterium]|nr:hypothetical protein [Planctomycetota bacterium]